MRLDPIKVAQRLTNKGNALSHAKRLYRDRNKLVREECSLKASDEKHWRPVFKKIKRAFRAEFREPAWEGLWIDFDGLGYTRDGITHCVRTWIKYYARWKGFTITRQFSPESMEDVIAETWILGGLIAGETPQRTNPPTS